MPLPTLSGDNAKDLALSADGDLVLSAYGDLATVSGLQVLQQEILFRIRTRLGDDLYQPQMGTLLDTLIGRPNAQETADAGVAMITSALVHDGLLSTIALEVLAYPKAATVIAFILLVDASFYGYASGEALSLEFDLDLEEGLVL